jgi:serine protease
VVTGFSTATNAATAAFTPSAAGTVVVQVTVTDDLGVQATAELSVVVAAAPITPPTPTPSKSGGGGSMSVLWLAALWGAAWLLRRQPRRETLTPPGAR